MTAMVTSLLVAAWITAGVIFSIFVEVFRIRMILEEKQEDE